MLGLVAAVIENESPSQLSAAVIHNAWTTMRSVWCWAGANSRGSGKPPAIRQAGSTPPWRRGYGSTSCPCCAPRAENRGRAVPLSSILGLGGGLGGRRRLRHIGVFEGGQDVPGLTEGGSDDVLGDLEKVEDPGIRDLVENGGTLFAGLHDVGPAKCAEVLGEVRRLQPDAGDQLADGVLAVTQQLEHLNAGGVGQSTKQFRSYLVNGTGNFFTLQNPPRTGVITRIIPPRISRVEPTLENEHLTKL
jgi:hypothetical protein